MSFIKRIANGYFKIYATTGPDKFGRPTLGTLGTVQYICRFARTTSMTVGQPQMGAVGDMTIACDSTAPITVDSRVKLYKTDGTDSGDYAVVGMDQGEPLGKGMITTRAFANKIALDAV